jgi:ureidoglycolate lyase
MSGLPTLPIEPITAQAFAPYGELVGPGNARLQQSMNAGTAQRYFDVANVDVLHGPGARPQLSWCAAQAQPFPLLIKLLERHPLGSQAFIPVQANAFLVVVASSPDARPRVFKVEGGLGVNYARGTWHHPLIALTDTDFWILDRGGEGDNCDVVTLPQPFSIAVLDS